MSDANRLQFLKKAGQAAAAGMRMLLTGVEVVIDPNEPEVPDPPGEAVNTAKAQGKAENQGLAKASTDTEGSKDATTTVGSAIGRRALAAAEHKVGLATLCLTGQAVSVDQLTAAIPPSLALYPSDGTPLLEEALGLSGEVLQPDGDLEAAATARDLAWLPLGRGWSLYSRLPTGRLVAIGGYRRAALVQFGPARQGAPIWCPLANDDLYALLSIPRSAPLYLEEPGHLWEGIQSGRVCMALLGGACLEKALALPGARMVEILQAEESGLAWVPVWGLFSTGRRPPWTDLRTTNKSAGEPEPANSQTEGADDSCHPPGSMPYADRHHLLLPCEKLPWVTAWLNTRFSH